jgi:xylan 1,4-beta-xylosidase
LTIVDGIFGVPDRGVRPYVQIGIRRGAVSEARAVSASVDTEGEIMTIYTGWAYPPKDYAKWAALVHEQRGQMRKKWRRGSRALVAGRRE